MLKLLHIYIFGGIIYLIFVSLFRFRPMFLFYTGVQKYREHRPEIDSGTSFFLEQILKKFLYTLMMTNKFS